MKKTTINGYYEREQRTMNDWSTTKEDSTPICLYCGRELAYQEEIAAGMCSYCTEDTIEKYKAE